VTSQTANFLGLVGSLRKGSHSRAVLQAIADRLAPDIAITVHDLADIPLYNADLDGDTKPGPVARLKAAIGDADGIVISTPEYNYGIPGVLKNAIDWVSRPAFNSVLKGKPVTFMTVSPGFVGGARAQGPMKQLLAACLMDLLPTPELVFAKAGEMFEDGKLKDPASLDMACDTIGRLAERAGR
jgi:chromate reductase